MNKNITYTTLLGLMESTANAALRLDPASLKRLDQLSGRVIAIECTAPQLTIFLRPHCDGFILQGQYEQTPDCHISGSALALLKLMTADNKTNALLSNQIQLSGDLELSQKLQNLLADLDIDWEAKLAEYLGDIAAHQIGNQARTLHRWGKSSANSLLLDIEEYLHEETHDLPSRAELEPFYSDIEKLALSTDRLAARIERLQKTLSSKDDLV
ncbi:MAG: SCP2 sterol-binding domain-containing protein [Pseudomonadales bacterium]